MKTAPNRMKPAQPTLAAVLKPIASPPTTTSNTPVAAKRRRRVWIRIGDAARGAAFIPAGLRFEPCGFENRGVRSGRRRVRIGDAGSVCGLLLRQAVQRPKPPNQIDGMDADDMT